PYVITSTTPLADMVRRVHPEAQVQVVPNVVSAHWLEQGSATCRPWAPGDQRIIRYLPGSKFHEPDFAVAAPGLAAYLRASPAAHLEIVGPVSTEGYGFPPRQVSHRKAVPFEHLPALLASSWVTIAPLLDSPFTRCKSAIKFLESAAFGCPCIASPIPDMERCVAGGVVLASAADAWEASLRAFEDAEYRMAVGQQGSAWVLGTATTRGAGAIYSRTLDTWLAQHAG
ncbi:MAG: hypothetical protein RLZZ127_1466, partial [Planctomycetota bacterium]